MVYRPSAPVVLVRVIPVSSEVASTRALATAWLSTPAMRPIRMSVVEPTCAPAGAAKNASAMTNALNATNFNLMSNLLHAVRMAGGGRLSFLRSRTRECWALRSSAGRL